MTPDEDRKDAKLFETLWGLQAFRYEEDRKVG